MNFWGEKLILGNKSREEEISQKIRKVISIKTGILIIKAIPKSKPAVRKSKPERGLRTR